MFYEKSAATPAVSAVAVDFAKILILKVMQKSQHFALKSTTCGF